MFEYLCNLFAPTPAPRKPMAIRRKRLNPVYVLQPKREKYLTGKVGVRITEVRDGNDVGTTQHAHDERLPGERPEL